MKIAYFIGSLEVAGGMERVISLKANWLAENGYEIHIISFLGGANSFYNLDQSIQIHTMNCAVVGSPFSSKKEAKQRLCSILCQERFDVFVMAFPFLEHFVAGLNDGSKKIYEAHCTGQYSYLQIDHTTSNPLLRVLKKWGQGRRDRVVCRKFDRLVALTAKDMVLRGNPSNGVAIPNPNTFAPLESSTLEHKRVISVGRYSKEKGYDYLLKAWQIVEKNHPDWTLDIFGADSGDKLRICDLKTTLGLVNVNLNNASTNIEQEYLNSSIFAMSSLSEGFGMVLAEAMSCGVPCVAFDCDAGPSEIIRNDQDGILVETKNVQALAQGIIRLIEHPELRQSMGRKAQQNIARFSMESVMALWQKLFENIIK